MTHQITQAMLEKKVEQELEESFETIDEQELANIRRQDENSEPFVTISDAEAHEIMVEERSDRYFAKITDTSIASFGMEVLRASGETAGSLLKSWGKKVKRSILPKKDPTPEELHCPCWSHPPDGWKYCFVDSHVRAAIKKLNARNPKGPHSLPDGGPRANNSFIHHAQLQYRILYFQPGHVGNTSFSDMIWIFELPQLATLVLKQFSNIHDISAVYLSKEKTFNIRRQMLSQITIQTKTYILWEFLRLFLAAFKQLESIYYNLLKRHYDKLQTVAAIIKSLQPYNRTQRGACPYPIRMEHASRGGKRHESRRRLMRLFFRRTPLSMLVPAQAQVFTLDQRCASSTRRLHVGIAISSRHFSGELRALL
ncbi:hypothetical protein IWZ01DRAFT_479980 [Phyllosticta capitalensis]